MRLAPVVKGAVTYIPGLYKAMAKRRTGGTDTAGYCYGVWLKHLTLLWANGLRTIPETVAELGAGDSLGVGLAALLSGVNHYCALDVVHYANTPRNLLIFEQLVALFQQHAGRPTKGWPDYDQYLDANLFPSHILPKSVLEMSLAPERIAAIRTALVHPSPDADCISIRYVVPWNEVHVIRQATVDLILSHSVLEHVINLEDTYRACALWLKPGGWMSHQIDFTSHDIAKEWNGYWTYPDWLWKIIVGKRPFLINRQPCSHHLRWLHASDFKVVCQLKQTETNGIKRSQLAPSWQGLSEDDLACSGTFIQARKP